MRLYVSTVLRENYDRISEAIQLVKKTKCSFVKRELRENARLCKYDLDDILDCINGDMNFDLAPDFDRTKFFCYFHHPDGRMIRKSYDNLLTRTLAISSQIKKYIEFWDLHKPYYCNKRCQVDYDRLKKINVAEY